ncbi:hypothetical protein C8D88_13015 [Lentzea atacamensis]|uniref:Uncharacterized protein n=1 Tax=Lentzea atacamensis TaxID=531938 RepID=A0A316HBU8_9PSEU|nr:hypothetical protein [Lentzea atacamensis]PWK77978.1 hypothetical protein C8D88_13015 [Lentzea atacamensis]
MTPLAHRVCLWAGLATAIVFLVGFIPLAGFFPVPTPDWSAERLTAWMVDHKVRLQAGCVLMIVGGTLWGMWAAGLTFWTREPENRYPVLYLLQAIMLGAGVALFVLATLCWAVASYRAGEISPEITQTIWDMGWFMFLFTAPPFIIWGLWLALGILWNPPEQQVYPRWSAYMTLALNLSFFPPLLMIFFDAGPVAYNGLLVLWLPLNEFCAWGIVMTILAFRAIARQEALQQERECRAATFEQHELAAAPSSARDRTLSQVEGTRFS